MRFFNGLKNLEKDYGLLTFSDLLLIQREDKNWTQTRIAGELKISKQKLCDFEKGQGIVFYQNFSGILTGYSG